jgi:multisubunit Na+/H+ antiporter MnhB subunit
MALGITWVTAVVFGFLSIYGWFFFFMVGNAHGPGFEIGVLAGTIAMAAAAVGVGMKQRERKRYKDILEKIANQGQP